MLLRSSTPKGMSNGWVLKPGGSLPCPAEQKGAGDASRHWGCTEPGAPTFPAPVARPDPDSGQTAGAAAARERKRVLGEGAAW